MEIFKFIGALGIILISVGIVTKKREYQNLYYIAGGICLEAYSIYIGDLIFIILQAIFILSAVFNMYQLKFRDFNSQSKTPNS